MTDLQIYPLFDKLTGDMLFFPEYPRATTNPHYISLNQIASFAGGSASIAEEAAIRAAADATLQANITNEAAIRAAADQHLQAEIDALSISSGAGMTQLTGDVLAGPGGGLQTATLATVNSSVGTFQGLTIDSKGRVTGASNQNYVTAGTLAAYAPLASPVFTGDPRAPTPAASDNDTSIATTAFVKAQGYMPSITWTTGSVPFATSPGSLGEDNAELFWDNTNNRLGVGTAAPVAKVDVTGPVNARGSFNVYSGTGAFNANDQTGVGYSSFYRSAGLTRLWDNAAGDVLKYDTGGRFVIGGTGFGPRMNVVGVSGLVGGGGTNGILSLTTGTGTNIDYKIQMGLIDGGYGWIDMSKPGTGAFPLILNPNGGNVAVGTVQTSQRFTVTGVSQVLDGTGLKGIVSITTGTGANTDTKIQIGIVDALYGWIDASKPGSFTLPLILNQQGGQVVIGSTAIAQKFTVTGTGGAASGGGLSGIVAITTGTGINTDNKIQIGIVDSQYGWIDMSKPGSFSLPLVLNPNGGPVGIGVTAPVGKMMLSGTGQHTTNINTAGVLTNTLVLDEPGLAALSGGTILFSANNGVQRYAAITGFIGSGANNSSGDISFQTRRNVTDGTLTETARFTSGGVTYNVSGTWTVLSDREAKQDIETYDRGLAAIMQLKPVRFRYKAGAAFNSEEPSRPLFGLIADEVVEVVPEVVGSLTTEKGELATLEPGNLIYALINAVKELKGEVDVMKEARHG